LKDNLAVVDLDFGEMLSTCVDRRHVAQFDKANGKLMSIYKVGE